MSYLSEATRYPDSRHKPFPPLNKCPTFKICFMLKNFSSINRTLKLFWWISHSLGSATIELFKIRGLPLIILFIFAFLLAIKNIYSISRQFFKNKIHRSSSTPFNIHAKIGLIFIINLLKIKKWTA